MSIDPNARSKSKTYGYSTRCVAVTPDAEAETGKK